MEVIEERHGLFSCWLWQGSVAQYTVFVLGSIVRARKPWKLRSGAAEAGSRRGQSAGRRGKEYLLELKMMGASTSYRVVGGSCSESSVGVCGWGEGRE